MFCCKVKCVNEALPDNSYCEKHKPSAESAGYFIFGVDNPGESAAGIIGFTDTVTIKIDSGDPGGEVGEFREFMRQALSEWYDGAKVK